MGISFDLCSIDELHMWVDAHQIDGDMMAEFKENIINSPFLKEVQNPLESLVTGSLVVGQVEKATVRAAEGFQLPEGNILSGDHKREKDDPEQHDMVVRAGVVRSDRSEVFSKIDPFYRIQERVNGVVRRDSNGYIQRE